MENDILKTREDGTVISVKDVQLIVLEILKEIDTLCQQVNISYWLEGQSALEAMYQQGFDTYTMQASVAMLREDYRRFLHAIRTRFDEERYVVYCYENNATFQEFQIAMKICKRDTYIKKRPRNDACMKNHISQRTYGVCVNVVVYDCVSNNRFLDLPLRLANQLLAPVLYASNVFDEPCNMLRRAFMMHAKLYGKMNHHSSYIGYALTHPLQNPLRPHIFKRTDIFPVQYIPFEDTKLPVVNHVDAYFKELYHTRYQDMRNRYNRIPKYVVDIEI